MSNWTALYHGILLDSYQEKRAINKMHKYHNLLPFSNSFLELFCKFFAFSLINLLITQNKAKLYVTTFACVHSCYFCLLWPPFSIFYHLLGPLSVLLPYPHCHNLDIKRIFFICITFLQYRNINWYKQKKMSIISQHLFNTCTLYYSIQDKNL